MRVLEGVGRWLSEGARRSVDGMWIVGGVSNASEDTWVEPRTGAKTVARNAHRGARYMYVCLPHATSERRTQRGRATFKQAVKAHLPHRSTGSLSIAQMVGSLPLAFQCGRTSAALDGLLWSDVQSVRSRDATQAWKGKWIEEWERDAWAVRNLQVRR